MAFGYFTRDCLCECLLIGSESDMDIKKELHPLSYYIYDRNELINQAFKVIGEYILQVNLCQKLSFLHQLTNPQYDDRLFIELRVQYMKIPSSNLGRTCFAQKLFLTFRTIFVHNMFSPCSAKRRDSDKDLPVQE